MAALNGVDHVVVGFVIDRGEGARLGQVEHVQALHRQHVTAHGLGREVAGYIDVGFGVPQGAHVEVTTLELEPPMYRQVAGLGGPEDDGDAIDGLEAGLFVIIGGGDLCLTLLHGRVESRDSQAFAVGGYQKGGEPVIGG